MSTPLPFPELAGLCRISQGEKYLTRYKDRAVTSDMMPDEQFIWKVKPLDPMSPSPDLQLILMPPPKGPPIDELFLTLDKPNMPGVAIPISVVLPMTGAEKRQVWTLRDMQVTKRIPLLFTAKIDSAEIPELVAATGEFVAGLPNPFRNVDAVPRGVPEADETWTFDYLIEKE